MSNIWHDMTPSRIKPEDFICVWAKNKTVLANQNGADGYALEKLYTTKENENKPITFFEF